MFRTQQSERPSRSVEDNALHEAGYGMHERGTNTGWVRSKSLYATAEKHPVIAAAVLTGAGSMIWNAAFKKR